MEGKPAAKKVFRLTSTGCLCLNKRTEKMNFNYQKVCQRLLKASPQRTRDILSRRFGLVGQKPQTLQAIGTKYGITRERVRQIIRDGLLQIKPKMKTEAKVFQYLENILQVHGGLKQEQTFFEMAASPGSHNELSLLLTCGEQFERQKEDKELYSLWTTNQDSLNFAKELINYFVEEFEKRASLLSAKALFSIYKKQGCRRPFLRPKTLLSYIEISKKIEQGPQGLFGLRNWPEISPRGVKDKAYLVLRSQKQPLHFTEITSLINKVCKQDEKEAVERTVHNELIKDQRFVLLGRGVYGLRDWGYEPGQVKDVIFRILKRAPRPLTKKEIINKVLKQRFVKPNTVLLNLNNNDRFVKDEQGRYCLA